MTTTQPPADAGPDAELLAAYKGWPDAELLVLDRLGAVLDDDGQRLGPELDDQGHPIPGTGRVDTETPGDLPPYFIRVTERADRGGIDPSGNTATATVQVEVYGPSRASVKRMSGEVTELLLALDRGRAHRGVLVDNAFQSAPDAPELERDEGDRRRSSTWTFEWRRHFRPDVWV